MILILLILLLSVLFIYHLYYVEPYDDLENIVPKNNQLDRFEDIKNVLYINLDERTDRREQAEGEFRRLGLNAQRVQAVKMKPGALGCTLSHIKCVEMAKEKDWDHVMICEDDILFSKDVEKIKEQFNKCLSRHKDWDVIALGVTIVKGKYLDDSTARIQEAWCTTCYIVRKEYYDVLLQNFNISAKRLRKNTPNSGIDQIWQSLQKRDHWLTILPIVLIQHGISSDIDMNKNIEKDQLLMIRFFKNNIKNYPETERIKNHISLFR